MKIGGQHSSSSQNIDSSLLNREDCQTILRIGTTVSGGLILYWEMGHVSQSETSFQSAKDYVAVDESYNGRIVQLTNGTITKSRSQRIEPENHINPVVGELVGSANRAVWESAASWRTQSTNQFKLADHCPDYVMQPICVSALQAQRSIFNPISTARKPRIRHNLNYTLAS